MKTTYMRAGAMAAALAATAMVSACGGGGIKAPSEVAGTWGADCSQPFVKFDGGKVTVFPDNATYTLKSATLQGGQLTVAYDSSQGAISEVYVLNGATLRLDHGNYGGTDATWEKAPMNRCS